MKKIIKFCIWLNRFCNRNYEFSGIMDNSDHDSNKMMVHDPYYLSPVFFYSIIIVIFTSQYSNSSTSSSSFYVSLLPHYLSTLMWRHDDVMPSLESLSLRRSEWLFLSNQIMSVIFTSKLRTHPPQRLLFSTDNVKAQHSTSHSIVLQIYRSFWYNPNFFLEVF